ncbi:unnamed protein product [Vitrella brassicaformis CCMP3155]|uniref:TLDc domain-containing protein n=1 Tax=Vitrella brassicaformis (strain CCMP3155) TaxID=1169540 RepID=A0A0G4EVW2_VITBC|nr:unnamed protein product [Vitrella brassicaformis CCMP3155]|eukprot:CEM02450.1 unnamed protein product [Vitrella brassicaformis CCMP3155]
MKVVDFARRQRLASVGGIVKPPTAPNQRQLTTDCGMYGLTTESVNGPVLWADELQWIIDSTKKGNATLLFKSSRDTFGYQSFLNKVTGKSGLLFALRDGDTHRFGYFIDGQLKPPNDRTETTGPYKVPLFFFSLSGAYETPTKIELPEEAQCVDVAGTQGAAKARNMDWRANVAIACGRLWLGFDEPGPAADLSRCYQWIKEGELQAKYKGNINSNGNGTLARTSSFTCDEMEVYHVQVNGA